MQENIQDHIQDSIQDHPLYSSVYEMVSNPDKTEPYNHLMAQQWLLGEKEYFNGLSPLALADSGEEGHKEVLGYIEYLSSLSGKEFISE
jgi:hypothetical protein